MDLSKFKTSDWLKIGGTAVFLIFSFTPWVTVEAFGFEQSENAWEFFWTGILPWILLVGVGVISFLLVQGTMKRGSAPWPLILLGAAALATLLVLIRFIFNPLEGKDTFEDAGGSVGRGFGLILCTIASIAVLVGTVLGFKESGGDLNDLKDINKIKSQFGGAGASSSATPPPPPPAGGTPPPPPPPA